MGSRRDRRVPALRRLRRRRGLERALRTAWLLASLLALVLAAPLTAAAAARVLDAAGNPIAGAMVTVRQGEPAHGVTVFTADDGSFPVPESAAVSSYSLRVRRIGWKDLKLAAPPAEGAKLVLERETNPAAVAAQLPANRWYARVLERIEQPEQREELKRQCTYCHQQGSWATRQVRDAEEWRKVLALMGRMGGLLSTDLRERLPDLFNAAYEPAAAVAALTAGMHEPGFAPAPSATVRRAVVEEWDLGSRASMQHDVTVHPDGRLYSVDMTQDKLYRLDPSQPDGGREAWSLPVGDLPLGGVFASAGPPDIATSNARVGPHSLQVAPDGAIWITLALGNQLARFDPVSEAWSIHALDAGYYPHTLRFDARGRIWFTLAASNHLGVFDPATGEQRQLRLPARTWGQAAALRMLPALLWLGRHVDLRSYAAESDGVTMPIPYGIDVAPDGAVWFSQLNEHRLGRVDPDSFEIEMLDTPFTAPRRLRFDSKGALWVPGFSAGVVARFEPATREFRTWELPIEPLGSETPYALHVDRRTDTVWICGTNSDTLIRFEPERERFTVYPLPTRVTYTRELDFDAQGRIWTSNSNAPAWQIEGGMPRVLRLDPEGASRADAAVASRPVEVRASSAPERH